MTAETRAICWAQWRVMWNSYSRSPKLGSVFGLVVGCLWYGLWLGVAALACQLFAHPATLEFSEGIAAPGLFLVFLYWQLIPLLMAATGAALDMRKLIVYPIPHGQLFGIEVFLRVTVGVEMLLVVTGVAVGVLFNPSRPWWAALAMAPFVAFNLFLAAGARDVMSRLFARRRVREIAVFLFVLAAALPQVMLRHGSPDRLKAISAYVTGPVWPWSAAAEILLGRAGAVAIFSLAMWTAAAYVFGRWQFERGLRFDEAAAAATPTTPGAPRADRLFRWPSTLFSDPLAALAEKELRTMARSPRFRLVFIMGFTFGLLIWLPMVMGGGRSRGVISEHYLTMVSLYALLLLGDVCFWNSFGFDRSAAQAYFAMPAPFRSVLLAKNIVSVFFVFVEITAIVFVCALLRTPITPAKLFEAYSVTLVVSLYMLAIGNMISVYNPRPVDPTKSMRSRTSGRIQALLMFVYPIAAAPVLLAYVAEYAFDSSIAFYLVLVLVGFVGAAVYWVAMDSSIGAALRDTERILTALAKGEGPIQS